MLHGYIDCDMKWWEGGVEYWVGKAGLVMIGQNHIN